MDRVILFKMIGLVMLVIGVFILIWGLLVASGFFKSTGFAAIVIAGALIYYSINVTPADKVTEDTVRAMDEALKINSTQKK